MMEGTAGIRVASRNLAGRAPWVAGWWAPAALDGVQEAQVLGWDGHQALPSLDEDDINPVPVPTDNLAVVMQPGTQRPMILIHRNLLNPITQRQGPALSILQRTIRHRTGSTSGAAPKVLRSGSGSWGTGLHGECPPS